MEHEMIYKVYIGEEWCCSLFEFDSYDEAIAFATVAVKHSIANDKGDNFHKFVRVDVLRREA